MKRNLIFASTIVSLLTYIFFFIEKEERTSYENKKEKEQIINFSKLGRLKSLKSISFAIKAGEDDRYYSEKNNLLLNDETIDYLFSELLKVKVLRKLEVKDDDLFMPKNPLKLDFSFERGDVSFFLGNRVEVGPEFYLKIVEDEKETLVLCKKEGAFNTQSESEKTSAPYQNFKSLMTISEDSLYEKRPFKYFQKVNKISLENFRNTLFSIDFENEKVSHQYKFNAEVLTEKIKSYRENLYKLSARKIIKEDGRLSDEIGKFVIEDKSYKVFKKYNGQAGYFLSLGNHIFEIDSKFFRSLFSHPQDFINKKINAHEIILNNSGIESEKLISLFNKSAYMLSPIYKLNKDNLKLIRTDFGDVYVKVKESEVILYDLSKMIAYHYLEKLK